jgi:hypothetical protein
MKVISISDREGAAGPTSARRTQALQKIRDTASALLGQAFREMLDRADDLLFAFAEKAENNTQQSLYFDAMRELRAKRTPMHQSFMEALGGGFDRRCLRGRAKRGDAGGASPSTLSLLDDATMEQDITIAGLAERIATAAREELFGLNKRLAQLLDVEELSAEDNPIGPTTIVEAARSAADALAVDFKVRLIVLKLFDRHVGAQVPEVYAQLNQQLIEQGILPTIAMQVRRQQARAQGPAAVTTTAAPADMLTMLNQLMQPGALAAGAAPVPLIPINVSAMQSLTQLQRQPLSALIGEEQPGPRMLVDLQRGGVLPQMGPAGDMTIDIVAMLFEYILEDRNVPEEIRARLARLQIPILKVALIDREFFSRKAHPARRLLNLIAESATLASSDPITAQELVRIIDRLVHRITAEFDQDVGIFGRSVLALQSAMQKLKQEAAVRAKRSARVVDGRAQLERAKELARGLLDSRLRPEGVPESVRNFLLTHWQRLLITLACKDGEDSETLRTAIRTMDQLVWSTLPKSTVEERRKLTRMLPELLTQLRAGMEAISMPAVARNNFLARIEKIHGEAVRGIGSQPADHPNGSPAAAPSFESDSTATAKPVVEQADAPKLDIDAFVATRQTPTSAEFPADFEMLDITTGEVSSDLNELLAKEAAAAVAEGATDPSNGIAEPQQPLASTPSPTSTIATPEPARPSRSEIAMRMLAEAQSAAEQLRARLDTGDEVRLADVMPPVDQLPEPAPTSKVNALLDITANTFYRLFTPGSAGGGTTTGLQFEELTLGDTRDPATARLDGHYLDQVKALRPGSWLEMRREDGSTVQVRLGAFDEGSSRFRFVDRHGHAIAERTLRELVLDFSRGSARTITEPPGMLDRAFTRLLDPSTWRGRNR